MIKGVRGDRRRRQNTHVRDTLFVGEVSTEHAESIVSLPTLCPGLSGKRTAGDNCHIGSSIFFIYEKRTADTFVPKLTKERSLDLLGVSRPECLDRDSRENVSITASNDRERILSRRKLSVCSITRRGNLMRTRRPMNVRNFISSQARVCKMQKVDESYIKLG